MGVLERKTLILTGASMGIGRSLAPGLARKGVNLVLNACGGRVSVDTFRLTGSAPERAGSRRLFRLRRGPEDTAGHRRLFGVFRPWKEKGALRSPEEAAQELIGILENDPRKCHGTIEESLEV